jgi:ATP-dependent helicase/nuclease subunit A
MRSLKMPDLQVPPDQRQRIIALQTGKSVLVQAPAGSGKTDLLTRRFLRLLGEVDDPSQIVAITFTIASAAEMRHRILSELEKAEAGDRNNQSADEYSMENLAIRALDHSRKMKWNLLDLPSQLRISTIDSFCRVLALQEPLVAGLGGDLQISEQPAEIYRLAARRTLEKLGDSRLQGLSSSIEALLLWRDNGWHEMEDLLVSMLEKRDRWMQNFVFREEEDWVLRERLERPFTSAVLEALSAIDARLDQVADSREELLTLARLACEEPGPKSPWSIAERTELPRAPFIAGLGDAHAAFAEMAAFLQTKRGRWRSQKGLNAICGFPPTPRGRASNARFVSLIARLNAVPGLESALSRLADLPDARYTEDEWQIVRSCFTLLRFAVAELKIHFAEVGTVDFVEVAQIAQKVLKGEDGFPTEAALAVADGIRHLLVDEFQDTSRRQHQLIASLAAAWPDQSGRTIFVVGDPMQSIYFFRDADAELFPRLRNLGLDLPDGSRFLLTPTDLTANFRTEPSLVKELNDSFAKIFEARDGSGVTFLATTPARDSLPNRRSRLQLHLEFMPKQGRLKSRGSDSARAKQEASAQRKTARASQTSKIVDLIRSHADRMEEARKSVPKSKYRIAILGRTRSSLAPIASALRLANIPFRAVELEQLKDRPEILDVLSLARALFNPLDRVAWLGVLRAPWCGLSLEELHAIAGDSDKASSHGTIRDLLSERLNLLSKESRQATCRVLNAFEAAPRIRATLPTASLGTLLQQVWLALGGQGCVNSTGLANLNLLWSCLDSLPEGEQDLIGSVLNSALEKLCASPNPAADTNCGVQLMTIHKSKGLEFEVVIVPDLQASAAHSKSNLLSWLERGLAEPDDTGDITEFLIAPLPSKGSKGGKAQQWVNRVYRERELQEMRRILYVAATRARDELHLFICPEYKIEMDGQRTLADPTNSLLATAWPAFADPIRTSFEKWENAVKDSTSKNQELKEPIAATSGNLFVMPTPITPTILRRLLPSFQTALLAAPVSAVNEENLLGGGHAKAYQRHEGGRLSRALGNAVHKLLQEFSRIRLTLESSAALAELEKLRPRISSQVRAAGVAPAEVLSITSQAFECVTNAAHDELGKWILSPRLEAVSEASWAGLIDGDLRLVRVDRIFRAGASPLIDGEDTWWIIDHKTAHADDIDPSSALPRFRAAFAPQLERYGAILRNRSGSTAKLRVGLYYPRMLLLDWWEPK